ncbi:hypothetical protein ACLOJK_022127, partial [Asimina triloba]
SVPIVTSRRTSRRSTKPSNQHPKSDPSSDQFIQPFKNDTKAAMEPTLRSSSSKIQIRPQLPLICTITGMHLHFEYDTTARLRVQVGHANDRG